MRFPHEALIFWFEKNKRKMPWRENRAPYRVWVAEVMLQQTQVKTVIPYYEKWMKRFPTIEDLAKANEAEVILLWEGLGYYSRARSLLNGAKMIVEEYGGKFPETKEELSKICGLGPYTIGAILNFAFHKRAPLVDGNVMRVLTRFYAIAEPIDKSATQKKIWQLVEEILPEKRFWVFTEALMELGATICQKKANCSICPLKGQCEAKKSNLVNLLPRKEKKLVITSIERQVAIVIFMDKKEAHYLLQKVEDKLMKGLFEFPFIQGKMDEKELCSRFEKELKIPLQFSHRLKKEKHSFTRYSVTLYPYVFKTNKKMKNRFWKTKEEIKNLPFSSGHRRIANQL